MSSPLATGLRTHACGLLTAKDEGTSVKLAGWVHSRRDHGGLYFFDLRDRTGLVQVVVSPDDAQTFSAAGSLGAEFVVGVEGTVGRRPKGTENPKLPTGEVEVRAQSIKVLNSSKTLPFELDEHSNVSEETRLKYRFLDLRRARMRDNLIARHKVSQVVRRELDAMGFLEIETPILTKATPEGARDYLVPARLSPGLFYALPQSPQIFKQILMAAGMERYFQLARAFRDEDLRSDRQPEHTQIDLEMSFVEEKDVHAAVERFMKAVFKEVMGVDIPTPFARIEYDECMRRYGSDKPDLRYDLEIIDLTDVFRNTQFKVFGEAVKSGGVIAGLTVNGSGVSRSHIDRLTQLLKDHGAKGLPWIRWRGATEEPESPIAKFFSPDEIKSLKTRVGAKPGEITFFSLGAAYAASAYLGVLRKEAIGNNELAKLVGLTRNKEWSFHWVVHFPLLEWEPEEKRWTFTHNPFTAPLESELPKLDTDPGNIASHQYDLVLNGVELASGSIRNHRGEVQRKILSLMGFSAEEQEAQFGLLLRALEFGAPPHGGAALGLDRLIAILRGEDSIREVIAFPKTAKGTCPLSEAPSPVKEKQLEELHIKLNLPPLKPDSSGRP
ncbi:MAG: aspartate--tRNA ligase [Elusimicrobia bacterium]|nr:aspartate--tRNA ligase [Elusimicrobiota bacterium]